MPDPAPAAPAPIRVALVEDDVAFQDALSAAVRSQPDLVLSALAGTRAQGLEQLQGEPADVLVVDLGLPDGSGIDVIREAHRRWPACGIMVSTAFGDEANVMRSIEAGASGYLLKDSAPERLVAEIRSLHAGGSPISPLIARQILMRFREPAAPAPAAAQPGPAQGARAALSPRELQVLEFIKKGFGTHEIAGLLAVSPHTVLTYVRRIYAKLEVNSRTEAVYEAFHQGLLG